MRAIMLVSAIAANRFIATQLLRIGVLAREQAVQERALLGSEVERQTTEARGAARRPKSALIGIMPVILVKLIMACSGSGVPRWRRWC